MKALLVACAIVLATASISSAAEVTIAKKKAWHSAGQSGYVVSYMHEAKLWKNAKVYCVSVGKPIYLIENLDRGDGVKMGLGVGADEGGLATEIAPGYMNWAIDLWRQTCS